MSSISSRNAYFDNAKALLIILVVLGHFLLPVANHGRSIETVYYWIYAFHMPAFVFVSGFFSKSYTQRPSTQVNKLIGFLFLYLIFVCLIWLVDCAFRKTIVSLSLFTMSGAPWYLLCMFFWYTVIPYFARLRPLPAIVFSVIIGVLIGTDGNAGSFLSLSRCIVFFPFFLLGYYFPSQVFQKIRPWMSILSAVILLLFFLLLAEKKSVVEPFLSIIYADKAYEKLSLNAVHGITSRLIWYLVASLMTAAFLCLVPRRQLLFTYLGQRTLSIYILHRVLRDIFRYLHLYDWLGEGKIMLIALLFISLLIVLLTSGPRTSALFRKAFSLPIPTQERTISS